MQVMLIRACERLPHWMTVGALTSSRIEILTYITAILLFMVEALAAPFVTCRKLSVLAYQLLRPGLFASQKTIGFEIQSGSTAILVGLYSQWGKPYLKFEINITYGPNWVWTLTGIVIGTAQIVAVRHGAENRAVAMVFGLAYWCALAIAIGQNAGLTYVHMMLTPACWLYLLCIFELHGREHGR